MWVDYWIIHNSQPRSKFITIIKNIFFTIEMINCKPKT